MYRKKKKQQNKAMIGDNLSTHNDFGKKGITNQFGHSNNLASSVQKKYKFN